MLSAMDCSLQVRSEAIGALGSASANASPYSSRLMEPGADRIIRRRSTRSVDLTSDRRISGPAPATQCAVDVCASRPWIEVEFSGAGREAGLRRRSGVS